MGGPTTQEWCDIALSGELVVNIGQIDKQTERALNKLVRQGKLARCRGFWCNLLIGPPKTIWCAPHALWSCEQFIKFSEARLSFFRAARTASAAREQKVAA